MNWMRNLKTFIACFATCLVGVLAPPAFGAGPLDDEGRLVQFSRDIAPIFRDHCLECHGPKEAKADFRVDDPETVGYYVEAGDAELSSLYTDYMTTDSEDELMPPVAHNKPLSAAQLALVRTWIAEGAAWPADAQVAASDTDIADAAVEAPPAVPQSFPARFWVFQGVFHPATVHFPIALLLVGGMFVLLSWRWPILGTQIPLACLLIGAATSIVASMMGWSFAAQQGYGSLFDPDKEIFWHRWSGIIVTVVAVILAGVALKSLRSPSLRLERTWKLGLVALAAISGLVGHQGGELHYGKDFYPDAVRRLLGTEETTTTVTPISETPAEETPAEETPDA